MNTKDTVIVPTSGGKDSALCLALAKKHYQNVISVFHDTGWEHPDTYKYLDYLSERLDVKIHITKGYEIKREGKIDFKDRGSNMEEAIVARGSFPGPSVRFCTEILKQRSFLVWYEREIYDGKTNHEIWFGMRSAESSARKERYKGIDRTSYYEPDLLFPKIYNNKIKKHILIRLPILDLHEYQVFQWLKKLDIEVNPLYEKTGDRVGCYPCFMSTKKQQKRAFATPFGKIQLKKIKALEDKIGIRYEPSDSENDTSCMTCQI